MPPEAPIERLAVFLERLAPFNLLSEEARLGLAGRMLIEYFPAGTTILAHKGPPAEFAYLIQTGAVRVFLPAGPELAQDLLVDMRAEGEMFGLLSVLEQAPPRFQVEAAEDSLCYLIRGQDLRRLAGQEIALGRHFARSLRESTSRFYRPGEAAGAPVDPAGLTARVGEVMKTYVLTCRVYTPVIVAARGMAQRGIGSVVVVDENNQPLGVLTNTDLRDRIVAEDASAEEVRAGQIMSQPALTVSPQDYAFEATLKMVRHGLAHLPVVDQSGRLCGIVAEHDLLLLSGQTTASLFAGIDRSQSLEDLVARRREGDLFLERLLKRGGSARQLIDLTTELNDRLTRRLIRLSERKVAAQELGWPPVPYAWLALGSEGRREQTLRTDQDNALIFANVPERHRAQTEGYFLKLAGEVVAGLETLGFPRCQGGFMASNPEWCQPEAVWQERFRDWIADPDPQKLRWATIFFDFRPIHAEGFFAENLGQFIGRQVKANRLFLRHLASAALFNRPPLGFFRQFVLEKSGDHRNKLNLKLAGLGPIVDGARVLSLDLDLGRGNTLERLRAAADQGGLSGQEADDLAEAYAFIMLLRLQRHLDLKAQGLRPDNYLAPGELNRLQRQTLKEAFHLISRFQDRLEQRYQTRYLR